MHLIIFIFYSSYLLLNIRILIIYEPTTFRRQKLLNFLFEKIIYK